MSEQRPLETFAIDPSATVAAEMHALHVVAAPDASALQALAGQLKSSLPAEPRLLVINPDEDVNTPNFMFPHAGYPQWQSENDVVVKPPPHWELSEAVLAAGVGHALQLRRRERQRLLGVRAGGLTVATGIVSGSIAAYEGNGVAENIALGVVSAGIVLVASVSNRSKPKPLDSYRLPRPIRLQPAADPDG